jgi:hypothetical protein
MKPISSFLLVVALLSTSSTIATAQASTAGEGGARIRVHRTGEPTKIGRLIAREPEVLVVQWIKGTVDTVPTSVISRLEVSDGHRSFAMRGALTGLATGTAVGLVLTKILNQDRAENQPKATNVLPRSIAAGVSLGFLLGAMGTDDWHAVPTRAQTRVGMVSDVTHRQIGLEVSRSF